MLNNLLLDEYAIANLNLQLALGESELNSSIQPYSSLVRPDCCNLLGSSCCNLTSYPGPATIYPSGSPFINTGCIPCCAPGGTDLEVSNYAYQQTLPYIQQANVTGACCCFNKY